MINQNNNNKTNPLTSSLLFTETPTCDIHALNPCHPRGSASCKVSETVNYGLSLQIM